VIRFSRNGNDRSGFFRIAVCLALVGVVACFVGLAMPRYRDQREFDRRYSAIDPKLAGASSAYQNLRAEFLTSSAQYQDYGITSMLVAGLCLLAGYGRKAVVWLPISRWGISGAGVVASVVTTFTFIGSLFLDAARGEFPWWADSLGIPLMGVPFVFGALLGWVSLNVGVFVMPWGMEVKWWQQIRRFGVGAGLVALVGLLLLSVFRGDFWGLIITAVWMFFYAAMARKLLAWEN
jgi:hypothetical protein